MTVESATYISDLNNSYPASGDSRTEGDDHIRLIKTALGGSFPNFAGAAMTCTEAELNILDGATITVTELNYYHNKTLASTDDVIDNFPSGTLMVFQQTTAPTGWTKGSTHNDKSLRVVTGTASSGGADGFSSVFGTSKTTGGHTLTAAESGVPAHNHYNGVSDDSTGLFVYGGTTSGAPGSATEHPATGGGGGSYQGITSSNSTASASTAHTHTLSLDLEYADVIFASKD